MALLLAEVAIGGPAWEVARLDPPPRVVMPPNGDNSAAPAHDQRINIRLSSADLQGLGTPALQEICERRVD